MALQIRLKTHLIICHSRRTINTFRDPEICPSFSEATVIFVRVTSVFLNVNTVKQLNCIYNRVFILNTVTKLLFQTCILQWGRIPHLVSLLSCKNRTPKFRNGVFFFSYCKTSIKQDQTADKPALLCFALSVSESNKTVFVCVCRSSSNLKTLMSRRRRTCRAMWTGWSPTPANWSSKSRTMQTRVSKNTHSCTCAYIIVYVLSKKTSMSVSIHALR